MTQCQFPLRRLLRSAHTSSYLRSIAHVTGLWAKRAAALLFDFVFFISFISRFIVVNWLKTIEIVFVLFFLYHECDGRRSRFSFFVPDLIGRQLNKSYLGEHARTLTHPAHKTHTNACIQRQMERAFVRCVTKWNPMPIHFVDVIFCRLLSLCFQ